MELLYNSTALCGSDFPLIGNWRKIRSNSEPINHSISISKNSKHFIRILFKIIHRAEREMDCLRGTGSTPTFLIASCETLPKSFLRGRDRQSSFWRRSFHSVRKNVVRQSERFVGKHFKSKSKRSRGHISNSNNNNKKNKILNDLKNFSTHNNDRTLPSSAVCDIALSTDNSSVSKTTSKNHRSR